MIENPSITQTERQHIAVIPVTCPRSEIRSVMGPGLAELRAAVAAQHVSPCGPWFTHHLRMDPDVFEFEIGVPVPMALAPLGRMQPGEWPEQRVARATYHGPYERLGAAWGEFEAWIAAQGHACAPDFWECYVIGPEPGSDPSTWRTEFYRPLVS